MSAHSIKLSVACLLLLGVALIFVSEGAEAGTWEALDDSPSDLYSPYMTYDSESDRIIVFETAGAANTPGIAINICQRGGTVVLVGIYSNKPSFDFNQIVGQEKKVLGSVATSPGDLAHAIKLIGDGRIKLKPLISDVVPLSNVINEGFNRMLTKNKDIYRILVDPKN